MKKIPAISGRLDGLPASFGKRSRLAKLIDVDNTVAIGTNIIQPSTVDRDLGVLLHSEFSMKMNINKVTST